MSWVNDYQPLKEETLNQIQHTLEEAKNTNTDSQELLNTLSSNVDAANEVIEGATAARDQISDFITDEMQDEFAGRILKVGLKKAICCPETFVEGTGYLPEFSEKYYPELIESEQDSKTFATQSIWFIIEETSNP